MVPLLVTHDSDPSDLPSARAAVKQHTCQDIQCVVTIDIRRMYVHTCTRHVCGHW